MIGICVYFGALNQTHLDEKGMPTHVLFLPMDWVEGRLQNIELQLASETVT